MSARKRRSRRAGKRRPAKPAAAASATAHGAAASDQRDAALALATPPARSARREAGREHGGGAANPARRRAKPAMERPKAPWHPLPVSELLIVAGTGAVLFALANGPAHSVAALVAGLAAVAIGTLELTAREHFSGYRSHALLLALLPVIVLHSVIVLAFSAFGSFPRLANVGLLAVDVALAFLLFRFLRARYVEARRRAALAMRAASPSARA
jgi:hypothetical protein